MVWETEVLYCILFLLHVGTKSYGIQNMINVPYRMKQKLRTKSSILNTINIKQRAVQQREVTKRRYIDKSYSTK